MALSFNLSNLFGSAPASTPASTPSTPGNMPAAPAVNLQQTPQTDVNGVIPNQTPPAVPVDNSPLAPFKDLWQTATNVDNKNNNLNEPVVLNAEDVAKAMGNADFSAALNPSRLNAIAAGGQEAQKAFQEALTDVARQVLTQATLVNNRLTNDAIVKALAAQEAKLPAMLRTQSAANHLKDTNPIFSNPAIQPVIEATQQQLLSKFPNATPAEITAMTNNYILAMGEAFAPKPATPVSKDTDWENFIQV